MEKTNTEVVVSLKGSAVRKMSGLHADTESALRIQLPLEVPKDALTHIQRDCEILIERLKTNPAAASTLLSAVASGSLGQAREAGRALALTEQEFVREGGGLWWLLVAAVCAAVLLYPSDAY